MGQFVTPLVRARGVLSHLLLRRGHESAVDRDG
jgi:hypothetical protein